MLLVYIYKRVWDPVFFLLPQFECLDLECIHSACLYLLVLTEKCRPEEDLKDLDAKNKITRDMVSVALFLWILYQFDCFEVLQS